jgi:hypothetical protein
VPSVKLSVGQVQEVSDDDMLVDFMLSHIQTSHQVSSIPYSSSSSMISTRTGFKSSPLSSNKSSSLYDITAQEMTDIFEKCFNLRICQSSIGLLYPKEKKIY